MKKITLLLGSALLSAMVFAACTLPGAQTEKSMEETESETMMMDGEEAMMDETSMAADEGADMMVDDETMGEEAGMMDDEGVVVISGTNFKYAPNTITAAAGETVTVRLDVEEGFHDFVIDELDVATEKMQAGNSEEVTFTIPEDASGETYEFYCSVGEHREMGMVGTLVIE